MSGQSICRKAESMGLSASGVKAAWGLIDQAVEDGIIPGGSAAVVRKGHTLTYASGYAVLDKKVEMEATVDSVYDCASLTKVVITLPLLLKLSEQRRISLEDPVIAYMPDFGSNGKERVTIRQLLAHTSGLAAHADLYSIGWTKEEILQHICRMIPEYEPGQRCVYSCLGYIILGHIIELISCESLQQCALTQILKPLGMSDSCYVPPVQWMNRIAATEYDTAIKGYRWGRVHDENAYALGGISGNAGLFATASNIARYAQSWLAADDPYKQGKSPPELLSKASIQAALQCQTKHIKGSNRGLGWVLRGDSADPAQGDEAGLSSQSFGHTGFTGTSLWIDPIHDLIIVLMTNRVHINRNSSIRDLRHHFHRSVAASVLRS